MKTLKGNKVRSPVRRFWPQAEMRVVWSTLEGGDEERWSESWKYFESSADRVWPRD